MATTPRYRVTDKLLNYRSGSRAFGVVDSQERVLQRGKYATAAEAQAEADRRNAAEAPAPVTAAPRPARTPDPVGVTRCEAHATTIMEPTVSGHFVEAVITAAHLWRCDGCGLVWEKRWHAETCASRGHAATWEQGPYGVQRVENGRLVGTLTYYTRRAVRRDPR